MSTRARRRVAIAAILLSVSAVGSAQEVIRISSYRAQFGKNLEVSKVTDQEITGMYAGMKGLKWVKFYYDPTSGERGSVTVWADRAALDAYMKSEARQNILAKLRPLIEGDVTSRIFLVHQPGKAEAPGGGDAAKP
jgi:quinol monooxygenase YgiN